MRSVKYLLAACAATMTATGALAADMPSIMPPPPMYAPPPPPQDFGGWYLRGDIGISRQAAKSITHPNDSQLSNAAYVGTDFSGAGLFGVGVGYAFNNWFRGDITAEYRSSSALRGSVIGTFSNGGIPVAAVDNYSANVSSVVVMANAYVDLGTWWCITPFIGAGVGTAYHMVSGFRDDGLNYANFSANPGVYFGENGNQASLAWAVHAGLAYRVNQNLTMELAYRYIDMGKAMTGTAGYPFDRSFVGSNAWTVRDITSHDLKVGLRWTCCDVPPPPPPPLVRKG